MSSYLKVLNNGAFEWSADIEGPTRVERLVMIDQKDGKEWELVIHDGKLIIEPYKKDEKRDFRIEKVIEKDGDK